MLHVPVCTLRCGQVDAACSSVLLTPDAHVYSAQLAAGALMQWVLWSCRGIASIQANGCSVC